MLTKHGALITDMRGKLGGQVYSKNRYGQFVCNAYKPLNPQTTYQQQNRAYLANVVAAWKQLSESNRLSWNSAAMYLKGFNCFGDSFSYTAYNCFVKCNLVYFTIYGSVLSSCPSLFTPAPVIQWHVTCITEQQLFQIGISPYFAEDTYFFVYATRPLVAGRKPRKSDYRRILFTPTTNIDDSMFTNAYTTYFGGFPPIGSVVHFKLCVASSINGIMSSSSYASATASSYLTPIIPFNLNLASFDSISGVLSLNASTSAFACLTACDFSKPFSFRFRLLTVSATAVLRCNFASINTQIPVNDSRNRYRILPNPTNHAWIFNLLGSTLGGAPVVSVYDYVVFSYDGSKLLVYSGSSFDDLTLYGSFSVVFSGVGYINFCLASANATQIDSIAFNR